MKCICSDAFKASRRSREQNEHAPYCELVGPYRDGNPDHIDTDGTILIEERIIASACQMRSEGRGVRRRVLVSFAKFFDIAKRRCRVKAGPHGEYIKLLTPAGYLWIVPSSTIKDDSEAYAFEQRTVPP